jgi:hypothetical protein
VDAIAQVCPDGLSNYVVEINGCLPVFWAGNLLTALAARNINVISGRGAGENRNWSAKLLIDARRANTSPDRLDVIGLATTEASVIGGGVKLSRFALHPMLDGRLEVRVFAPDQAGFLSRLLRAMALVSLFPRAFEIDTPNGQIEDRFVVSGTGNTVSTAARQALEGILRGYTTG